MEEFGEVTFYGLYYGLGITVERKLFLKYIEGAALDNGNNNIDYDTLDFLSKE